MAENSFFLNFGSNAGEWATKLDSNLQPATDAIIALIDALSDYDAQLERTRGQNAPLDNLFARLDQVTSQFSQLTTQLGSTFGTAVERVETLRGDITQLVEEIKGLPTASAQARAGVVQGLKNVTEEERAAAAKARGTTKPWIPSDLTKIIDDAAKARAALKRVGDINSTVASNAATAADKLSLLGQAIRDLTLKTKVSTGQIEKGNLNVTGGNVILLGGGVGGVANLTDAGGADQLIRQILQQAGVVTPQTRSDAEATAAALKETKGVVSLSAEQVRGPASAGRYRLPGMAEGTSRAVGFDILPGESFEGYFGRSDKTIEALQRIRSGLKPPNPEDLELYRQFISAGGKDASALSARARTGGMSADTVKASLESADFLTASLKRQLGPLSEAIVRIEQHGQRQVGQAMLGLNEMFREHPMASFQGDVSRVFRNPRVDDPTEVYDTLPRALSEIEARIKSGEEHPYEAAEEGYAFREEARQTGAALRPGWARRDQFGQYAGYMSSTYGQTSRPGKLAAPPETLTQRLKRAKSGVTRAEQALAEAEEADRQAAEQVLETAKSNLASVREEASELKQRRAQSKRENQQVPVRTEEQIRAMVERHPDIQAMDRKLREGLSDADVKNALGIKFNKDAGTDYERFYPGEERGTRIALQREQAQTQLEAFTADPEGYLARHRASLQRERQEYVSNPDVLASTNAKAREGIIQKIDAQLTQSAEELGAALQQAVDDAAVRMREASTRPITTPATEAQLAEATAKFQAKRDEEVQTRIQTAIDKQAKEAVKQEAPVVQTRESVTAEAETPATSAKRRPLTDEERALRTPLASRRDELKTLKAEAEKGTPEYQQISQELRDVRAQIKEIDAPRKTSGAAAPAEEPAAPAGDRIATLKAQIAALETQQEGLRQQRAVAREPIEELGGFAARRGLTGGEAAAFDEVLAPFNALGKEQQAVKEQLSPLRKELNQLERAAQSAARAEQKTADTPRTATGGAGGAPPRPPRRSGGTAEEEPTPGGSGGGGGGGSRYPVDFSGRLNTLRDETRAELELAQAEAQVTAETRELSAAQRERILQAAATYREDPATREMNAKTLRATFAQGIGLPYEGRANVANREFLSQTFKQGGLLDADPRYNQLAASARQAAEAQRQLSIDEELVAASSRAEEVAILRLAAAQERLADLQNKQSIGQKVPAGSLQAAQASVINAQRQLDTLRNGQDAQQGGAFGRALFGQSGFLDSQLRHFGRAIENIAGYTLVFSGFEKVKELVDTGIQADAEFADLQGQLDATGKSVGNLRSQLQGVSSATAQSLPSVIEAASELSGVFKTNADLVEGTKIASMLANISEGTLTAKEAAVGLRDVTDAYGLSGTASLQKVGDEITRLHQITGVSVKDVVEGTTQLAQESVQLSPNDPAKAQRQAAVLAAFVTRSTGETGEAAAEQVSRILSQLNVGRVQNLLERTVIQKGPKAGQLLAQPGQFERGELGDVLTNLLGNFDNLDHGSQQAITAMVGTGRQARAFAGLLRDAGLAAQELNSAQSDTGALSRQNQRYLNSLAGTLKELGTDFKNLGATLQQLGVFDILGLFAKSLDDVLKAFNSTFGAIAHVANMNSFTKMLKDLIVLTGEAALAFKVFGGVVGNVLGKINPGRATIPVLNSRGEPVIDPATGAAQREFAPVTFGGAIRGVRRAPGRVFGGLAGLFVPQTLAREGMSSRGEPSMVEETRWGPIGAGLQGRARLSAIRNARLASTLGSDIEASAMQRAMNSTAVAARGLTDHMGGLKSALGSLSAGTVGAIGGFIAISYLLDKISEWRAKAAAEQKDLDAAYASLDPNKTAQDRAKAQGTAGDDQTAVQKDYAGNTRVSGFGGYLHTAADWYAGGFTPWNGGAMDIDPGTHQNWLGQTSSTGFDETFGAVDHGITQALIKAKGNAKALTQVDTNAQKVFAAFADEIKNNPKMNETQKEGAISALQFMQSHFENSFQNLLSEADGIKKIDQLNNVQATNLVAALQEAEALTAQTAAQFPGIAQRVLDQFGLTGSQAATELAGALGYKTQPFIGPLPKGTKRPDVVVGQNKNAQDTDYIHRLEAFKKADEEVLKSASEYFKTHHNPTDPQYQDWVKAQDAATQDLAQQNAAIKNAKVGNPQTRATQDEARGNNVAAIKHLKDANKALAADAATRNKKDPEYLNDMAQIDANKKHIAELTYQHAIGLLEITLAGDVSPLKKANDALALARKQQAAVAAEPGGGSVADRQAAAAAVAQATLDRINAKNDQYFSKQEMTIAQLNAQDNPFASARAAAKAREEASEKIKRYLAEGGVKGDTTYNQLEAQLASAIKGAIDASLAATLATIDDMQRDTTDPIAMAVAEVEKARAKLLSDIKNKKGDPVADRIAVGVADQARQKAAFDQQLSDQQTAYDLHRESAGQFLQFLEAQDHLLRNQIAGMKKGSEGYRQRIEELNQVDQAILGLNSQMEGQFNLGSIKVPTVYEVRRQIASQHVDASVTTNNVTINGVDIQQVINYINSILGPGATGSRTPSAARKVPS